MVSLNSTVFILRMWMIFVVGLLVKSFDVTATATAVGDGTCENLRNWRTPMDNLTCDDLFDAGTECNNTYFSNGHFENSACCFCPHGGIILEKQLTAEYNISIGHNDSDWNSNSTEENGLCIDRKNWEISIGNMRITCDHFTSDICQTGRGRLIDTSNLISAREACCACSEGGYRGSLIGKQFRVGVVADTESLHQLYSLPSANTGMDDDMMTLSSNKYDGSLMKLMQLVSESHGFGMYEQDIVPFNGGNNSSNNFIDWSGDSPYNRKFNCIFNMMRGNVDMCLAPTWRTGFGQLNTTDALFTDDFYVVSTSKKFSLSSYYISVGKPFEFVTWIVIFSCILFLGLAITIVLGSSNERKYHGINARLSHVAHVLYSSLQSFVSMSGEIISEHDTVAVKIIAIGFVLFSFLTVATYTAAVAATLVRNDDKLEYKSITDVLQDPSSVACVYRETVGVITDTIPGLPLYDINGTVYDLLDEINRTNRKCTLAIVPLKHYERASIANSDYCKKTKILLDEIVVSLDIVLYTSVLLQETRIELINAINSFIQTGEYDSFDTEYYNNLRKSEFDVKQLASLGSPERRLQTDESQTTLCNGDDPDGLNDEIAIEQLFLPFMFTIVGTSLGLLIFFCKRFVPKILITLRSKNNHLSDSKVPISAEGYNDEESQLLYSCRNMLPNQVVEELISFHVEETLIAEACNYLPDQTKLNKLFVETKSSFQAKEFRQLLTLDTYVLYNIHKVCYSTEIANKCLNHWSDPKKKLVEDIMRLELAKKEALALLNNTFSSTSEIKNEHIDDE